MKRNQKIAIVVVMVVLAMVWWKVYQRWQWEQYQVTFQIPRHVPATTESRPTKIPKRILRSFATDQLSTMFTNCVMTMYELNPDYEHTFFTDEDCDEFMHAEYAGRVANAYDTLIPGAYRSDLFRICYLYKYGGVYLDINKTILLPLTKVINGNYDLVTVIDRPSCCVWQAFMACVPGLPVLKECIDQCVRNVESRSYGEGNLDITGPMMMGRVFKAYYGECVKSPGVYRKRGELVKLLLNDGEYNEDEFGNRVVNLNTKMRRDMDKLWKQQNNRAHYGELYEKRMVYRT